MNKLGSALYVSGFCVEGHFSPSEVEARLVHLVDQISMSTGGMCADTREFPMDDGKGGVGSTVFQPLVESFSYGVCPAGVLVGDTWHDFNHTYFVIASCKPYSFREVGMWLHNNVGRIIDSFQNSLLSQVELTTLPNGDAECLLNQNFA